MPELAKAYEPRQVEDRLYAQWQESGVFRADPRSAKPAYSIVMPPPNVTGKLTLGHVLNNTIQDILARQARMQGKEVLWLPGTDHAGLATQTAVEKHLRNQEKKTAPRFYPRGIRCACLEMERGIRRRHHPTAAQARRFLRLVARALHLGRRLLPSGAGSLRPPLSRRPYLPRYTHGQLVPGLADRAFRRGSHPYQTQRFALLCEVRAGARIFNAR